MIRHLIKLIWNKKRSNFLLTTEIFASFLVLFGVLSLVFYNYGNYAQPLGYEYENVWAVYFNPQDMPDSLFRPALERAKQQIRSHPEVEAVGRISFNSPFSMSSWNSNVTYEGKSVLAQYIVADHHLGEVLNMKPAEGHWFEEGEIIGGQNVVVINRQVKEALFGDGPAVGKSIKLDSDKMGKVVGVLDNYKNKSEFQSPEATIFLNYKVEEHNSSAMLIKVKSSADARFEAALTKELSGILKGAGVELSYLTDQRRTQHGLVKVPMIVASIVCAFLLINVCLGLFGVLWYNIRKRRDEIGLRRALGATRPGIMGHFVGEALVIAAFGIFVGLFFAIQLPLMDVFDLEKGIYFRAIAASTLILGFLVALCALYPSRQAAGVQPAVVLHEE